VRPARDPRDREPGNQRRALIVEDDPGAARALRRHLERHGYTVQHAADGERAWKILQSESFDLLMTDLRLPGIDGIELIGRAHPLAPSMPIIVTTAFATIDSTVEALRCGAADYLPKPFGSDHFDAVLARSAPAGSAVPVFEKSRAPTAPPGVEMRIGRSARMREAVEIADRVAASEVQVLIRGETGVGKELMARRIHAASSRGAGPFVRFNCGNLAPGLADAQLFGSERGAYTSSVREVRGVIEEAADGTLFLDEIGELSLELQVRLLDLLQERTFRRLGSSAVHRVNARLLMATHRDLERMLERGEFRRDLYYRIRQVQILIPPLRDRIEDLEELADSILARVAPGKTPSPEARALMSAHAWPGNVRELEYALIAAAAVEREQVISAATLRRALGFDAIMPEARGPHFEGEAGPPDGVTLAELERWHILRELAAHGGNVSATARALGIDRSTVQRKTRRSG
jgi:DNA-binding NtrC family response regulator